MSRTPVFQDSLRLGRLTAVLVIVSQILITRTELIALFCTPGLQDYEVPALRRCLPPPSPSRTLAVGFFADK